MTSGGNVTYEEEDGVQRFFDCDDRLVQIVDATQEVLYRYEVLGRRTSKKVGTANPILYFWDGWQCVESYDQGT
jgi:hypothetical protein